MRTDYDDARPNVSKRWTRPVQCSQSFIRIGSVDSARERRSSVRMEELRETVDLEAGQAEQTAAARLQA